MAEESDTSVILVVCPASADYSGDEGSRNVELTARSLPLQAAGPVKTEQGKLHSVLLSVSAARRHRGRRREEKRPREGSPLSLSPRPSADIQADGKENCSERKPLCSKLLHPPRLYHGMTTANALPRAVSSASLALRKPSSNTLHPSQYDRLTASSSTADVRLPRAVSAGSLSSSCSGDTTALCPTTPDETTTDAGRMCERSSCKERRIKPGRGKLTRIRKRTGKERI